MNWPPFDQRTTLTAPVWLESVASRSGVCGSSGDGAGDMTILGTVDLLGGAVTSSSTGVIDQILTRWSAPPVTKREPSGCTSTEPIANDSPFSSACDTHDGLISLSMARCQPAPAGWRGPGAWTRDRGAGATPR